MDVLHWKGMNKQYFGDKWGCSVTQQPPRWGSMHAATSDPPPRPNNKHVWGAEVWILILPLSSNQQTIDPVSGLGSDEMFRSGWLFVYAAAEGWFIPMCGLKIHDLTKFIAYVSIWLRLTGQDALRARGMRPNSTSLMARDTPTASYIHPSFLLSFRLHSVLVHFRLKLDGLGSYFMLPMFPLNLV